MDWVMCQETETVGGSARTEPSSRRYLGAGGHRPGHGVELGMQASESWRPIPRMPENRLLLGRMADSSEYAEKANTLSAWGPSEELRP